MSRALLCVAARETLHYCSIFLSLPLFSLFLSVLSAFCYHVLLCFVFLCVCFSLCLVYCMLSLRDFVCCVFLFLSVSVNNHLCISFPFARRCVLPHSFLLHVPLVSKMAFILLFLLCFVVFGGVLFCSMCESCVWSCDISLLLCFFASLV